MAKHVPGNPAFIVQNMPGAGSVIAMNYVTISPSPTGWWHAHATNFMGEFVITTRLSSRCGSFSDRFA
jgi:hypothetical protein